MKRLRHPIRAIREPFGTAGLIVACVALVAALGGTALAAAKLNGTQKKEVEKIAKKYAGKPGANGANGTNGSNGSPGVKGENGSPGAKGEPGTSVTASVAPPEPSHCKDGGSKFVAGASTTYACNGENGETGFTKNLPSGATETGAWSFTFYAPPHSVEEEVSVNVPISLSIPLSEELPAEYMSLGHTSAHCGGNYKQPSAEPGYLCVYENELPGLSLYKIYSANQEAAHGFVGVTGANMEFDVVDEGVDSGRGTWAVTAPEPEA